MPTEHDCENSIFSKCPLQLFLEKGLSDPDLSHALLCKRSLVKGDIDPKSTNQAFSHMLKVIVSRPHCQNARKCYFWTEALGPSPPYV